MNPYAMFVAAMVGALCLWVITGGAVTMMTGEKPSNLALALGAGLGAGIGAFSAEASNTHMFGSQATESLKSMLGGGAGDGSMGMRVGLAPQGL